MDLLQFVIFVCILGLDWWVVTTYIPMPPAGRTVLTIAFVVIIVLGLLQFLGMGDFLHYRPALK